MVAYTMRFRPAPARLKELLVEGSYGPPFKVSAWTQGFLDPAGRIRHWAARRDQLGGGVLFSHGCHYIDLIQWYLDALPIKVAMVGTRARHRLARRRGHGARRPGVSRRRAGLLRL